MMKKAVMLVVPALVLAACGNNSLIADRSTPDELRVIDAAPLTLPPDFELRPPRAGEKGKLTVKTDSKEAQNLVLGESKEAVQPSSDDAWLVKQAGGESRDQEIRMKLEVETAAEEEKEAEMGWFEKTFGNKEEASQEEESK